MCSGAIVESNSPKTSPSRKIGLEMTANVCDPNKKKVTEIPGKRVHFLHMISNTKPMSEIPTMKPLADKPAAETAE